jgi:cyanophycin synthetase
VLIRRHLDAGGIAFLYRDGWITEATANSRTRIIRAVDLPLTLGGAASFHIANALAATAACRAYGLDSETIAGALKNFHGDQHNAGRAGLYEAAGGYVLVDYGHNPDAFNAICRMTAAWPGYTLTGVIGVPGDRDDHVVAEAGRAAARGFHHLIIKEDEDLRGRRSGEVAALLRAAALSEAPELDCRIIHHEASALRVALDEIGPGAIVVIFYEQLDPVLALLDEYKATPALTIPPLKQRMLITQRSGG